MGARTCIRSLVYSKERRLDSFDSLLPYMQISTSAYRKRAAFAAPTGAQKYAYVSRLRCSSSTIGCVALYAIHNLKSNDAGVDAGVGDSVAKNPRIFKSKPAHKGRVSVPNGSEALVV